MSHKKLAYSNHKLKKISKRSRHSLVRNDPNILDLSVLVKDLSQGILGAVREGQVLDEQLVLLGLRRVLEGRLALLGRVPRQEHRPPVQRDTVVFYGFIYSFLE